MGRERADTPNGFGIQPDTKSLRHAAGRRCGFSMRVFVRLNIAKNLLGFSICWASLYRNRSESEQDDGWFFLGQVQRGRAREVRGVRCGRAAAVVWAGLLRAAGMAGAQQAPSPASPPTPTPTPPVVGKGANAATPAQT